MLPMPPAGDAPGPGAVPPPLSNFAAKHSAFIAILNHQRWSPRGRSWPRGHILKSLALASKPQVLENWPVLGSRTALFFEPLKLCIAIIINGQRYKRICYR